MQTMSPSHLVTLLFTFFFLLILLNLIITRSSSRKLPPGPWKFPFIGNMLSMISSELPHRALRNLSKKHGPLMHLQLGEISALIVSSPRVAKQVLVKHDLAFASRFETLVSKIVLYNSTDIGFSPYGNYWRQMRKICMLELLGTKKVQSFCSIREQEVDALMKKICSPSGSSTVNLSKYIFTFMNNVISRAAFGRIYKDQDLLIETIQEAVHLGGGFDVADLFPSYKLLHLLTGMQCKLTKVHQNLDRTLNNIIDEHNTNSKLSQGCRTGTDDEDLLDILLRLQNSGDLEIPITTENIKAVLLDIFTGGTDTAAATVEWAMSEMVRNPRVLRKAQAEVRELLDKKKEVHEVDIQGLKYLKLVIKETLRLHPPLPFLIPRECRESCEIDGFLIPTKTKVIVNAWALGRDPEYWHDAECFLPERFQDSTHDFKGSNLEYLPFGAGRRICPGISFGVANVELVLASLLYHFKWELPKGMNNEDLDMLESFGAAIRRKTSLHLIATPYF
ncbi:premnaspirodiene oxygenase-like [Rutidosis leptorrhynchoides]|uniref:premnaspirodiene oxygenase-like n=1 Tax=Rutidosis leptorrhynchoides TaxID=125765 RepID=UPI003A9907A3